MMARTLTTLALLLIAVGPAAACTFCISELQTYAEIIDGAEVAVIARLAPVESPPAVGDEASREDPGGGPPVVDPETGKAKFIVETILKGEDLIVIDDEVEAIYFGTIDFERRFFLRGGGQPLAWALPIELSPLGVDYIQEIMTLPKGGGERLAFFQDYLEHEDSMLARDAYDEFARAPNDDLRELTSKMDHERLIELINRPRIAANRRRLFFLMLSMCGNAEDVSMLEAMIKPDAELLASVSELVAEVNWMTGGPLAELALKETVYSEDRRRKAGLDAMIACYLALRGDEGLDLIDRRFLDNLDADQTHIYSVVMALRYLIDEEPRLNRERLLASARLLLNHRMYADQIVTDLARWEDWSMLDRLGELFRAAGDRSTGVSPYVRGPIVTYLDIAAEQPGDIGDRAEELIAELEPMAPDTFRSMRRLQAFGAFAAARKSQPNKIAEGDLEPADDLPPNPATFDQSQQAAGNADTGNADNGTEEPDLDELIAQTEAAEAAAEAKPARTPPAVPTFTKAPVPAGAEPLTPPARTTLVLVPLLAAAGCFGVFWVILRGGA